MTTGINDTFKVYYHLMSWDDSEDFSDGFWVVDDFGSRTDPSWTKRNIDTSFDGATAVYAIDIYMVMTLVLLKLLRVLPIN